MTDEAKEKRRDYMRNYQEAHRDKLKKYLRKWRSENPTKVREYEQRYWEKKAQLN